MRSSGSTSSIVTSPRRSRPRGRRARDLDVPGPIRYSPLEARRPLDVEDVRADALDVRAERDEKAAEILDVRLAGRVPEHVPPLASTAAMIAFSVP